MGMLKKVAAAVLFVHLLLVTLPPAGLPPVDHTFILPT